MSLFDEVYGLKYRSASEQMSLLVQSIQQKGYDGFESLGDLEKWAHDHLLDKLMFSNMSHTFLCLSHKGEAITPAMFEAYYGDILYWKEPTEKNVRRHVWHPEGFVYFNKAYINGEQSDGIHRPLYYRDYTVPTGYYCAERDAFNVAKPFPVFAAETGADTSHIYTYIQHIAGECAMWLLAWLRAKLLYPTVKTQIVPIIVSRAQGSGKTTFAEVICKGLFGKDNVIVSDQYDATARFNSDYADALIVCQEEKEEVDKRNPAGALKSRATATTIRKEQKGIDPIYQESYTDFIMTTNKDVPIKFDGREDQRRFMVMEADEHFTRKESKLADEVFTKLYGFDANYNKRGKSFVEDIALIAQFKHELFTREDIANVDLRNFPKTAAYHRCYTLPRTTESTEIDSILRSLAPFIKASLEQKKVVTEVDGLVITDVIQYADAIEYMPAYKNIKAHVALCRPLVFYETNTMKPYTHSTVERILIDADQWIRQEFGLKIMPDMSPLLGGFPRVKGRYKAAPAARIMLLADDDRENYNQELYNADITYKSTNTQRIGKRLSVSNRFAIVDDDSGIYETVNEMKPGVNTLKDKSLNVQYMDTFLLESDTPTKMQQMQEEKRVKEWTDKYGNADIEADFLYKERLEAALNVSNELFNKGIVCRIVYSGAKSYHLLVRVKDAPTTIEEYRWLHNYLCTNITDKLTFDLTTADPARLTRAPIDRDRVSSAYGLVVLGRQKLVSVNWLNVYDIKWRQLYQQWKERPLTTIEKEYGRPLYPTKTEYVDAAEAIIDGSFWSDEQFNGDRQRLFFPAYRVLRVLGYTHDRLWNEVIPDGLRSYVKQSEVSYWKTRADSAIIRSIDKDIDTYDEQWEDKDV